MAAIFMSVCGRRSRNWLHNANSISAVHCRSQRRHSFCKSAFSYVRKIQAELVPLFRKQEYEMCRLPYIRPPPGGLFASTAMAANKKLID
jgi:hypothetical protein